VVTEVASLLSEIVGLQNVPQIIVRHITFNDSTSTVQCRHIYKNSTLLVSDGSRHLCTTGEAGGRALGVGVLVMSASRRYDDDDDDDDVVIIIRVIGAASAAATARADATDQLIVGDS